MAIKRRRATAIHPPNGHTTMPVYRFVTNNGTASFCGKFNNENNESIIEIFDGSCADLLTTARQPLLRISPDLFKEITRTVYSEFSGETTEARGMVNVLRNRATARRPHATNPITQEDIFSEIDRKTIVARHGSNHSYNCTEKLQLDDWINKTAKQCWVEAKNYIDTNKMERALFGTVVGLVEKDITEGAYFWEATAKLTDDVSHPWRLARGRSDMYGRQWKGSRVGGKDARFKENHPTFCRSNPSNSLSIPCTDDYEPEFIWTRDYGATSFFKKNPTCGWFNGKRVSGVNCYDFP